MLRLWRTLVIQDISTDWCPGSLANASELTALAAVVCTLLVQPVR